MEFMEKKRECYPGRTDVSASSSGTSKPEKKKA